MSFETTDDLRDFSSANDRSWNSIFEAKKKSLIQRELIQNLFTKNHLVSSTDTDLVVFGSLARNECTESSDVDWTLLIDGQASSSHSEIGYLVKEQLSKAKIPSPGTSGVFGQMTFSHDVINYIGGQEDTNHNITRRVLLLLESAKIPLRGQQEGSLSAYDRVCRGIIEQYIINDSGFRSDRTDNVPRFLLNDIIRFWRTMCVDFAYKQREQKGKKWAVRNIKLRMSRKLIYIKGLLVCASCLEDNLRSGDYKERVSLVQNHLIETINQDPLDYITSFLIKKNINSCNR